MENNEIKILFIVAMAGFGISLFVDIIFSIFVPFDLIGMLAQAFEYAFHLFIGAWIGIMLWRGLNNEER